MAKVLGPLHSCARLEEVPASWLQPDTIVVDCTSRKDLSVCAPAILSAALPFKEIKQIF